MGCALFSFPNYFSAPLLFFSVVFFWNVNCNFFSPCLAKPLDFTKTGLIIIRVQNDFMENGPVAIPEASSIIPVINSLLENHKFGRIIVAHDWHRSNFISFSHNYRDQEPFTERFIKVGSWFTLQYLLPVHCVEKTHGAKHPSNLNLDSTRSYRKISMGVDEDDYSKSIFFYRHSEDELVRNYDLYFDFQIYDIETIVVVGIDVQATALDGVQSERYNVIAITDVCLYSNGETAAKMISEMKEYHVQMVNSEDLPHVTIPDEEEESADFPLDTIAEKEEEMAEKEEEMAEKEEEMADSPLDFTAEEDFFSPAEVPWNPETTALMIVRVQNDFMENGAVKVPGANSIIPIINSLLQKYDLKIIFVVKEWHLTNHFSFAANYEGGEPFTQVDVKVGNQTMKQYLWPVHCIQNTPGADLPFNLNKNYTYTTIYMDDKKDDHSESAFTRKDSRGRYVSNPDLFEKLESFNIKTIVAVGINVHVMAINAVQALFEAAAAA